MNAALGIFLTLLTINCFGQCGIGTMDSGEGYRLNRNVREGIDPKKKFEENDLISFLRVDSIKSKTKSYFLMIQVRNRHSKGGHTTITLEFADRDRLILHEQNIKLSVLDYVFGLDESEMFYEMNKFSYDKVLKADLIKIEIHDRDKILDVVPDKNLLKQLMKCLQ
jgi:hypothetical protein